MAVRTEADYQQTFTALLPPGPAWEVERAPAVHRVLAGLAPEFARVEARAADMVNEADPLTVRELLPDWERVMGLPDLCLGSTPSIEERRLAVQRRHVAVGGQSIPYFLSVAWAQGYPNARITEYRAPRFGRARFGRSRFGTWRQQFLWTLHLGSASPGGERPDSSTECLFRRHAPAHTVVLFDYEG